MLQRRTDGLTGQLGSPRHFDNSLHLSTPRLLSFSSPQSPGNIQASLPRPAWATRLSLNQPPCGNLGKRVHVRAAPPTPESQQDLVSNHIEGDPNGPNQLSERPTLPTARKPCTRFVFPQICPCGQRQQAPSPPQATWPSWLAPSTQHSVDQGHACPSGTGGFSPSDRPALGCSVTGRIQRGHMQGPGGHPGCLPFTGPCATGGLCTGGVCGELTLSHGHVYPSARSPNAPKTARETSNCGP